MRISRDEYKAKTDEEKKELKNLILKEYNDALETRKSVLSTMRMGDKRAQKYEYKVDTLMDCSDGILQKMQPPRYFRHSISIPRT